MKPSTLFIEKILVIFFTTIFLISGCDSGSDGNDSDDVPEAGFVVSTVSGNTNEEGATATFTVRLNKLPAENVVISVSSSDVSEGTVTPLTLTFTPTNWNANQTVTITGVDDNLADGNQAYTIQLALDSAGSDYSALDPDDVSVINTDMGETAGYTISSISGNTNEEGGTATFTVRLNSEPLENVLIDVTSSDPGEGTASPAVLTFTSTNWDADQTITLTGVDDDIADGNQGYTIQLSLASSGSDYSGIDPSDVSAVNTDMGETAGFTVSIISGSTGEDGTTAGFTVRLNSQPVGDVVIDIASSDTGEGTLSLSSLTFDDSNWDVDQIVMVTGVDDVTQDGPQDYTILLAINSGSTMDTTGYASLDPDDVNVTNIDDEWKLSDTGQTTSYTATWGEDADYLINSPSFSDNSDGTVTDNNTGLIWQQEDDNNAYTWSEAGLYCETLTLGSETGWRLPNRRELMSIANFGVYSPSINTTYFPNTNSSNYWSSTIRATGDSYAWCMDFNNGVVSTYDKSNSYNVRCIRGGK